MRDTPISRSVGRSEPVLPYVESGILPPSWKRFSALVRWSTMAETAARREGARRFFLGKGWLHGRHHRGRLHLEERRDGAVG